VLDGQQVDRGSRTRNRMAPAGEVDLMAHAIQARP
jgi:hypothetical protein